MSKKNLPYIPIYIGDWERDCNVLSLEAEMAWMKIIFKMHLSGKQSVYKTSTKTLQNIWKSGPEKVAEIIEELTLNEICGVTVIAGGYEFSSRRLKKENDISEVRSEAVKNRYKAKEDGYKPSTKSLQITDIDIEDDIDNKSQVGKEGAGEKPNPEPPASKIPSLDTFLAHAKSFNDPVDEAKAIAMYEKWKKNGWNDSKGNPIKNWTALLKFNIPDLKPNGKKNQQNNSGFRTNR